MLCLVLQFRVLVVAAGCLVRTVLLLLLLICIASIIAHFSLYPRFVVVPRLGVDDSTLIS